MKSMFFAEDIMYLVVVYLCCFFSLLHRKRSGSILYIYFIFVAIIETFALGKWAFLNQIYSVASFFYILFFTVYFGNTLPQKKRLINVMGGFAVLVCLVFMFSSSQSLPIGLGITVGVFYTFLSLLWFFQQFVTQDQIYITQKEVFWVSTAILFWSICFLFRITPMYWLEKNDYSFLIMIAKAFKIAVIITYVIFLVGVIRKTTIK